MPTIYNFLQFNSDPLKIYESILISKSFKRYNFAMIGIHQKIHSNQG